MFQSVEAQTSFTVYLAYSGNLDKIIHYTSRRKHLSSLKNRHCAIRCTFAEWDTWITEKIVGPLIAKNVRCQTGFLLVCVCVCTCTHVRVRVHPREGRVQWNSGPRINLFLIISRRLMSKECSSCGHSDSPTDVLLVKSHLVPWTRRHIRRE